MELKVNGLAFLMSREIIQIQIGNCGNKIGRFFWEYCKSEHSIDYNGKCSYDNSYFFEKINVYFEEKKNLKFIPRAILVDSDNEILDEIKLYFGNFYSKKNFIQGESNMSNNWAKGFYSECQDLCYTTLESIRKSIETCDSIQGFQIVHSLGGGTGSGFGSLLIDNLHDEYPDLIISTHSVIPSEKVADTVVDPYNCSLSLNHLKDSADLIFSYDNGKILDINEKLIRISDPSFNDLNFQIALSMIGITSSFRFPNGLNGDLRKMSNNLIQFPKLRYLFTSLAPLKSRFCSGLHYLNVKRLTNEIFDKKCFQVDCEPNNGIFMSAFANYCGMISEKSVDDEFSSFISEKTNFYCIEKVKPITHVLNVPHLYMSAVLYGITTSFKKMFELIKTNFEKLYAKKAFFHWYIEEGLESSEFDDAYSNLKSIIQDYESYENN